jgi:flagellar hook assembly protein FlgD
VRLSIFDLQGRRVRTLMDAVQTPGEHTVTWNGRSDSGQRTAAGLYILRLEAGQKSLVKKIIFSR